MLCDWFIFHLAFKPSPACLMDYTEIVIYLHNYCCSHVCTCVFSSWGPVTKSPGQKLWHHMHAFAFVVYIFVAKKSSTTRNIMFLLFCSPPQSGWGLEPE